MAHFTDGGLYLCPHVTIECRSGTRDFRYVGAFLCARYWPERDLYFNGVYNIGTSAFNRDYGEISSWGPVAWNKYKPGKPGADLALFIAEIKDTPRMLQTTCRGFRDLFKELGGFSSKRSIRKSANHYMNTQFGWKPFLSDLRKFYTTWKTLDRQINQIIRDNGQWIKRGGVLNELQESEKTYEQMGQTSHWPTLDTRMWFDYPNSGYTKVYRETYQKIWFSGRFRYWIPDVGSVRWRRKAARLLYGGSVNPALIWEATPWSWLIDWFSNVGDVFANLDNNLADNLTAKYAYLMGHTRTTWRIESQLLAGQEHLATWVYNLERKVREDANPFGFGLTWGDLTTRQWSILSALSLSRLR